MIPLIAFANDQGGSKFDVQKPKIALVISGDALSQSNDKAGKTVREALRKKFPDTQYVLNEDSNVSQEILTVMEDEKIYDISMVPRATLSKLGEKYGYDYVMLLVYNYGASEFGTGLWSSSQKVAVVLDAKVVNVKASEYIYRQNVSVEGKSSAGLGSPSWSRAVVKSMRNTTERFCNEIEIGPVKQ